MTTNLLETSLECLPDAVLVCDADGVLVAVNAAARRLLGDQFRPGRPLRGPGAPAFRARRPTGEAVQAADAPLARALRGEAVTNLRLVVETAGGALAHVSVSAVPLRSRLGEPKGATVVVREIVLDRALQGAVHRLRTTLTSVRGAAALLRRSWGGRVPPAVEDLLQIADRSTETLVLQVDSLLDRAGRFVR